MKNLLITIGLITFLTCFNLDGFTQGQGKGNQKKEQGQGKGNQGKGNVNKVQGQGQDQGQGQEKGKGNNKGQGQNNEKINPGKGDEKRIVNAVDRNFPGKENVNKIIARKGNYKGYDWNDENFKDRRKIRNEGKVTVCHKFNRDGEPGVTINISRNALQAHLNHGDVEGNCPAYTGTRTYSDIFLRRRGDYYNVLYGAQDQVIYSQSILDYALQRLTGARTQLVTLQTMNAPVYEIERKQAVVTELEDNVSLLEIALAGVAGLLVAKLID